MGDSLSPAQIQQVELIAEVEVRRYFDHYLNEVFPKQQKAMREHTHLMIEKHDSADDAHGGIELKFNRLFWVSAGLVLSGVGAGSFLAKWLWGTVL